MGRTGWRWAAMHDLPLVRLDVKVISLMSSEAALSLTKL